MMEDGHMLNLSMLNGKHQFTHTFMPSSLDLFLHNDFSSKLHTQIFNYQLSFSAEHSIKIANVNCPRQTPCTADFYSIPDSHCQFRVLLSQSFPPTTAAIISPGTQSHPVSCHIRPCGFTFHMYPASDHKLFSDAAALTHLSSHLAQAVLKALLSFLEFPWYDLHTGVGVILSKCKCYDSPGIQWFERFLQNSCVGKLMPNMTVLGQRLMGGSVLMNTPAYYQKGLQGGFLSGFLSFII